MTRKMTNVYELEDELVNACHVTVTELRNVWMQPIHGERINQRRADKAGSDKGSPDYLLCVGGWHHPLEFKRSTGGRFSLDQMVAAGRRRSAGVETYAPKHVTEFDALIAWSKRHFKGVCPDCPVVPSP
jgi:hypothetical protein